MTTSNSENAIQKLNRELSEERRELLVASSLTAVTLLGLFASLLLAANGAPGWLVVLTYVITYLAGGLPATREALGELRHGTLDIDLLMVLAALAAAAVGQPRDGAFLLFLFSLANVLEEFSMGNTKRAVSSLMKLRPERANLRRQNQDGENLESVAVESLELGDVVIIKPGEYIPVDGIVIAGESTADQSPITGESVPVDKRADDEVFAGTINRHGALTVRVSKLADATTLARMITLVTEAQSQRAPSQRFSEWFGQRYTIMVLVGSAVALAAFLLSGMAQQAAFYKAATLLVVASPCAIVISVPASILSALAAAARRGVLFKGGAALEDFGKVSTLAFDKTGTLTTGQLNVTDVVPVSGDKDALLRLAASIEQHSEHPIAASFIKAAREKQLSLKLLSNAQAHPGFGVSAEADGDTYWVGNRRLTERFGTPATDSVQSDLNGFAEAGKTLVSVGKNQTLLGVAAVSDTVRENSRDALASLRKGSIERLVMLTGDHRQVANAVGRQLGLAPQDVYADLLPDEKVEQVKGVFGPTPVLSGF